MDIKKTIAELDLLYEERHYNQVENFLLSKITEAREENDVGSTITLSNELMGHYRTTSRYKEVVALSDDVISLMRESGLEGTVPYATTILNTATAYREAGKTDEALALYNEVLEIYRKTISEKDMRFAGLFNNMSLVYNEKKDYEKAYGFLKDALDIVTQNEGAEIEEAITNTNVAKSLMLMDKVTEGLEYIYKALNTFEKTQGPRDFHYSATLSAMGEAQYLMMDYEKALEYFNKSLTEIEGTTGKNSYYAVTCINISKVYNKLNNQEQKEKYRSIADAIFNKLK